jgi:hypothetical protein
MMPKHYPARLENQGIKGFLGELAGEPGFEPRLTESESVVLPLNYSPVRRNACVSDCAAGGLAPVSGGFPEHRTASVGAL